MKLSKRIVNSGCSYLQVELHDPLFISSPRTILIL